MKLQSNPWVSCIADSRLICLLHRMLFRMLQASHPAYLLPHKLFRMLQASHPAYLLHRTLFRMLRLPLSLFSLPIRKDLLMPFLLPPELLILSGLRE